MQIRDQGPFYARNARDRIIFMTKSHLPTIKYAIITQESFFEEFQNLFSEIHKKYELCYTYNGLVSKARPLHIFQ